jgi:CIC family chloride channel protein
MLGASVGSFEKLFFPHLTGTVGSYALVGMGVLFAGFLRAPLTSVFMVLEVSGNYSIILPVILANTIAYLLSRVLAPVPIFEVFTHQDGLELPSMEEQREESGLRIEDALRPVDVPVFKGSDSVQTVAEALTTGAANVCLIHVWDGSWYAMRAEELTSASAMLTPDSTLERVLPPERVPVLFPDMPLDRALPYFSRWPVLSVMNRARHGAIDGVITLEDVLRRYEQQ